MKLTARQSLLLSRLVNLAELALDRRLPIDVLEILGFGSFFRGKARPKDVDLVIRCTRGPGHKFVPFSTILRHLCSDLRYQAEFNRPLGAFLDEFDRRHANMIPGLVSLDEERSLFSEWLEPYSWSMLFPKSVADPSGWEDPAGFARRLLRRKLPNLNVAYYIFPDVTPEQVGLRAGFIESIWSRERPDIEANVLDTLEPERALSNSRRELHSFHFQLFRLRATEEVLIPHAYPGHNRPVATFTSTDHYSLLSQGILLAEDEVLEQLGRSHEYPYRNLSAADVTTTVEQLRADVKELWPRVEIIRRIVSLLNWHSEGYRGPPLSAKELVLEELLVSGTPKEREFVRSVLIEFGFCV